MIKILITGKNSYIGRNFKEYLSNYSNEYYVEELDLRNAKWNEFDFSSFDVVFHVAGIAHISETKVNDNLYYSVNRDLAYDVAKKSKKSNVKQFIFMSSMSVYGVNFSNDYINKMTPCRPITHYGRSKYQAEKMLENLVDDKFTVCIVRPPMVYSDGAPGNLTKLVNIVSKVHIFPRIYNERSWISIEKLVLCIKNYIDNKESGILIPQNDEYLCTYDFIAKKMKENNKFVIYTSMLNSFILSKIGKNDLITKCFGNLRYEK